MIFNSLNFALFFVITYTLYWTVASKSARSQNILILLSSIVFYLLSDWKFISLLATSGLVNYYLARQIPKEEDESTRRKVLFYSGIAFNVGILLYFKYFGFFIQSFVEVFNWTTSSSVAFTPFHILLPLGISFYTFQLIAYLIDVNNEEIEPRYKLIDFFTYLAYFPKILSGPIEKIQDFIPQIQKKRDFDYNSTVDGMRQFLWGLFKKVVIADNCTSFFNVIDSNISTTPGGTALLGSFIYLISVYADFSGFSDMACGISKMFNLRIINNFRFPFFSTNISEYWKKWHISLTNWMMNYVYTPLSFILRRKNKLGLIISVFITFLLVGLWHGANINFIIFGILNGLYFIPIIIWGNMSADKMIAENGRISIKELIKMAMLFILVSLTAIFLATPSFSRAINYLGAIFSKRILAIPSGSDFIGTSIHPITLFVLLTIFFAIEWIGRRGEFGIANIHKINSRPLRWLSYIMIIFFIGMFMRSETTPFVYFQF